MTLRNLLSFRLGTWGALLSYYFLQRAITNVLLVLSTTLFLSRAGIDRLPLMYIVMNVVSIAIQTLSTSRPGLSSLRLLRYLSLAMIVATLAAPALLHSRSAAVIVLAAFSLQIIVRIFEILSGTLFLNIVSEIYPLRESKVRVPKLLAAASVSVILSGPLIRPLASLLTVEGTIASISLALAAAQILLARIGRISERVGARGRAEAATSTPEDEAARVAAGEMADDPASSDEACEGGDARSDPSSGSVKEPSRTTPRNLWESTLVRSMVSVAFLVAYIKFMMDFQYQAAVVNRFSDQVQLAAFLGYYEAGTTVLILAAQAFLTGPLLARLKLGVVVSLLPGIMLFACLAGALLPTFEVVLGIKVLYTVLANAFYNPAGTLLAGPLESELRDRTRLTVSTFTSLGCLAVGFSLQFGLRRLGPFPSFLAMTAMFAVALVLAKKLDRSYIEELRLGLSGADVRRRLENVRALRVVSSTYAATWILELLKDPDPAVRERALREVQFLGQMAARRVLEEVLLGSADPRLRATALAEVVAVLGPRALELTVPHLSDPDRRIQSNALEAVSAVGSRRSIEILLPYLDHPDHRLRAVAAAGIVRGSPDPAELDLGLATLAGMTRAPETLMRASTAVAMGDLGYPFFVGALLSLAADPVDQVASRSVEALEKIKGPDAIAGLGRLAQRPELCHRAARFREACQRIDDRGSQELIEVLDTLSGEERARLLEHLREVQHSVRSQVLVRALSLESQRARRAVVAYLHRAVHPDAPALVAACLATPRPSIAPALEAMRAGGYRGEGSIAWLIWGFLDLENTLLLKSHLAGVWERVRATLALYGRWPEGSPEEAQVARRRARLLAHGFTLVSLMSPRPREVVEALEKALEGDRFVSSISMEYVSTRVDPEAASNLVPLLEDLRQPASSPAVRPRGAAPPSWEGAVSDEAEWVTRSVGEQARGSGIHRRVVEEPAWDTTAHQGAIDEEGRASSETRAIP